MSFPRFAFRWSAALFVALALVSGADAADRPGPWSRLGAAPAGTPVPAGSPTWRLDRAALEATLASAPMESTPEASLLPAVVELPLPGGGFAAFAVRETRILGDSLAASRPDIRTWAGEGIDDPAARVVLDRSRYGFHAMIRSPRGTTFVDPVDDAAGLYAAYDRSAGPAMPAAACLVGTPEHPVESLTSPNHFTRRGISPASVPPSPKSLRPYRTTVSATSGYTAFHGGKGPAEAAVVTMINRVNQVYERDLMIRLVLVRALVFDASDDPFKNPDGTPMDGNAAFEKNQSVTDAAVGSANYDVGHVIGTNGTGGLGSLGGVCDRGLKALGMTFWEQPVGDAFVIDYVAHEFGHQFGANHSYNSSQGGACTTRNTETAMEPASGSTIMSYIGICAEQNLGKNSDDYFHAISLQEILVQTVNGSSKPNESCPSDPVACCGQTPLPTGENKLPVVDAGAPLAIPARTPFLLTGSATDADPADAGKHTFCWEEFDLGTAGPPHGDDGSRPIFRSYKPVAVPWRSFPSLAWVLGNDNVPPETYTVAGSDAVYVTGESLPTTDRKLKFRLTVRDNRPNDGSVAGAVGFADVELTVVAAAGPFKVTAPNAAASWAPGSSQSVTWDVAGTTAAPISAANVSIALTTDAGATWQTIVENTPNDGSETITVPNVATTTGRIRVMAVGNVFYDLSNADIAISGDPAALVAGFDVSPASPAPGQPVQFTDRSTGGPTSWSWEFGDGASSSQQNPTHTFASAGNYTVRLSVSNGSTSAVATKSVSVSGGGGGTTVPRLVVPGQARAAGAGSFFKSSVWAANPGSTPTNVLLRYIPQGSAGGAASTKEVSIAAGGSVAWGDVLGEAFGASGNTSGVIVVETADGAPVPFVTARTYNDTDSGTFGQYIPAVPAGGDGAEQAFYGLGGDAENRTNIGVANLSGNALTATITVLDAAGSPTGAVITRDVAPWSSTQVGSNLISSLPVYGARVTASGPFFAYASKLNNKTSDPIFIPGTLTAKPAQWIDGVAAAAGAGGTFFRSNLVLANPGPAATEATLVFTKRGQTSPTGNPVTVPLAAGETRSYADALGELFGQSSAAGYLSVTSASPVVAWGRTYNDLGLVDGVPKSFGQFIPAFGAAERIGPNGALLLGVSASTDPAAGFRTNFGLLNTAAADTTVTVTVKDVDGALVNRKDYPLAAGQSTQKNVTDVIGTGTAVSNGWIEITFPAGAEVYGWASIVDNRSTDQTFVRPISLP